MTPGDVLAGSFRQCGQKPWARSAKAQGKIMHRPKLLVIRYRSSMSYHETAYGSLVHPAVAVRRPRKVVSQWQVVGGGGGEGAPTPHGHFHLLQAGSVTLQRPDGGDLLLTRPSLIFMPRPSRHKLIADEFAGAQLVCASMDFDGGASNPLSASLPDLLVLPLDELPLLADTLGWLFGEAAAGHCGREAVLDRLFELLIILLLRHLLDHRALNSGMMAGLADSRLARSLVQMHNAPQRAWSVAELASESNMSRAAYAAHFRSVVGQTPADYLLSWRISVAQKRLREGRPIALIADEVGYESPSALARAFRRKTGRSPRDWMKSLEGS